MSGRTRHNPDTEAGIFFTAAGILTAILSSNYRFGNPAHMGPGFFPVILGCLLTVLGVMILAAGLRARKSERPERFDMRSVVIISGSIALFGFLLLHAGFLITVPLTVIIASFVQRQIHWMQTFAIAAGLTAFTYLVFIVGLELRIPLFPEFFAWSS